MKRRPVTQRLIPVTTEQALIDRARRCRRRGEQRRALVALREACLRAAEDPRLWCLYGALCWQGRRREEALHAFRQSLWFRERQGDELRARVIRALVARIEQGDDWDDLRAA